MRCTFSGRFRPSIILHVFPMEIVFFLYFFPLFIVLLHHAVRFICAYNANVYVYVYVYADVLQQLYYSSKYFSIFTHKCNV